MHSSLTLTLQVIQAILSEYKHIETYLETSAKQQQSVPDIFYYAIKSVVHPAEPLVEFSSAVLRPLCIKALKRIFLLCDHDQVSCVYRCPDAALRPRLSRSFAQKQAQAQRKTSSWPNMFMPVSASIPITPASGNHPAFCQDFASRNIPDYCTGHAQHLGFLHPALAAFQTFTCPTSCLQNASVLWFCFRMVR